MTIVEMRKRWLLWRDWHEKEARHIMSSYCTLQFVKGHTYSRKYLAKKIAEAIGETTKDVYALLTKKERER